MIKHGITECFECQPQSERKTFAICTIRATPEKPIHCIVWATSLFSLLFGPKDDDNVLSDIKTDINLNQPKLLFNKLFKDDINELIETHDWKGKNRLPPKPLDLDHLLNKLGTNTTSSSSSSSSSSTDIILTPSDYAKMFINSIHDILNKYPNEIGELSFDKDNLLAMKFVASAANLRMLKYDIAICSEFKIKGIAGNIIHAVATTNAIAAGLIVLEAIKLLEQRYEDGRCTWITQSIPYIINPTKLPSPNMHCYICSNQPVYITLNANQMLFKTFYEKFLNKIRFY